MNLRITWSHKDYRTVVLVLNTFKHNLTVRCGKVMLGNKRNDMRPQQVKEALSQIELVIKGTSTTYKIQKIPRTA